MGRYWLTIGDEPRFVWFRVPKAGYTTILGHLDAASLISTHNPDAVDRVPDAYRDHWAFAFVRNPWDRLVSCWLDKVKRKNFFGFGPSEYERMQRFDHFVRWVVQLDLDAADDHLIELCTLPSR